jgi:hypothetical protein
MQFYPHNLPLSKISNAVSASRAELTNYLNNFQSISVTVFTASLALNITGSSGIAGANYTKIGQKGSTGATGPQGFRGDSLYILSSSWNTGSCVPSDCFAINFGYGQLVGAEYSCDFGSVTTLYSKESGLEVNDVLYSNGTCTTLAANLSNLAYGPTNSVYSTNGSGVLSSPNGVCGIGV